MHNQLNPSNRPLARRAAPPLCLQALAAWLIAGATAAQAGAPATAPQVLLAITNSESMDGTTSGAIMVGSGGLASANASLNTSSSPTSYSIPNGFTPPLSAGSGGQAAYTVSCNGSSQCDNGPSRLNMTKAAIAQVLANYGSSLNFGLYTYSTGTPTVYTTWVYYMSPAGGFTFTNTATASTVANPCYGFASASANVKSNCTSIAGQYGSNVLASNAYMNIGATSDNAQINDVLYAGSNQVPTELLTYGTVTPANPFAYYPLSTYNTNIGGYSVGYGSTAPAMSFGWSTTPTNAGYVAYAPQVLYSMRGFGYGASQSATTGSAAVAMGTDPGSSAFTAALSPETSNASSSEIKSVAGQSGIYGLMNGAKSYLSGLTRTACQTQYVVMLTDGLPTLDHSGNAWPPLGTATANAYALTASFNADGSLASSNSQAVTDAVSAIAALYAAGTKVFVIGLGAGVDATTNPTAAQLLTAMAVAGGTTSYYSAADSTSLNTAFLTIVDIIYRENSVAAPVAPISVAGGTSLEYELTSVASPGAGHVRAYPVTSGGTAAAASSWDAGALMTSTGRGAALMSTKTDGTVATLANIDAAAFNLTPTGCVPNTSTIINYVVNPSYTTSSCSYLAGRESAWLLGPFSSQNTGRYVPPPSSSMLAARYGTYAAYGRTLATRPALLMFSDEDGFVYAIDAASGTLKWGWTSRSILAKLQNYATFLASASTDGGFTVADAMDGSSNWGSYVVGSLQSGAEHYVLKLDATGTPTAVVYDSIVSGGSAAGDKAGATGNTPLRQPPVVAYIGNAAYYVYVVTVGTTSTLYETQIATGTTTSATLGFLVSSTLNLTTATGQLWLGAANGTIWVATLGGTAASDAALLQQVGTVVAPSSGSALGNVLYVGYTEVSGVPYVYAMNPSQLTVFGVTSAGWTPLWASTPSAGYAYATAAWSTTSAVTPMTSGSVVSDVPIVVGGALLVPMYVAGTGCSAGSGYYDIFALASGQFPTALPLTRNNIPITSDLSVGLGPAYTPSLTAIAGGISANPGSAGSTTPQAPLVNGGTLTAKAISWRRH